MCSTISVHFEYIRILLMTSPDHLKMAPTCCTPVFDIFWEFFIRNYVKIRRKSVKISQMIENLYFFSCTTQIVCQHFFTFLFTCSNITTVGQNVKKLFAPTNGKTACFVLKQMAESIQVLVRSA